MSGFIDQAQVDMVINGQGHGDLAVDMTNGRYSLEASVGFDPGIIRPVLMPDGGRYCSIRTGKMITNEAGEQVAERQLIPLSRLINNGIVPFTYNATALPYRTWEMIDRAVLKASRDRLQAWDDLAAANSFGGFDGMATTSLIKDTMTDPGDAKVDMETLSDDFNDSPLLVPDIVPLPIIHAGASVSQRRLAQSRRSGMPLDTTLIEASGRRCSETLEKMTIGMTDFSSHVTGDSSTFTNRGIYGFRTQPNRILKTDITASASFVPSTFVDEVIAMVEAARLQKMFGPFILYYSTSWDQYLARDYFRVGSDNTGMTDVSKTVLQRVSAIPRIASVRSLDMFTSTDELLLVQMSSETVRAINGMEFTTVQWQKDGGSQTMLRVMGIKVPDLRSQYVGQSTTSRVCGIVHGTTSA
jgi:hypothetical protein